MVTTPSTNLERPPDPNRWMAIQVLRSQVQHMTVAVGD